MKPPVFTGTCTALITPFQSTGAIDYTAFAKQIDRPAGSWDRRLVRLVGQREKVLLSQQRSMSNWWITA